jgi:hypothetical protein
MRAVEYPVHRTRPASVAVGCGLHPLDKAMLPMKKTGYESELTKFMREFLDKNPQVTEKQKQARATWWDKPQALEDLKRDEESKVPQEGYVYYNKP